jgi:hypothetical protein
MAANAIEVNKYNKVTLYKERSESFVQRTVSLLERVDFASEYDKELQEVHNGLLEAGVDGYSAAEETMNLSASLADEYMLLADGIYSAVLTALYHLWERDIKDLIKSMLRYYPVAEGSREVTEQDIEKYKYDKLKSLLVFWGAKEINFDDINLLRLVVNTIKHSSGPSAGDLLTTNGKFYYKLTMLCGLPIDQCPEFEEPAMLNTHDIKYFGKALTSFWVDLGNVIYI